MPDAHHHHDSNFAKVFIPGLVLGLIVGMAIGVILGPVLDLGRKPTQVDGPRVTAPVDRRDPRTPAREDTPRDQPVAPAPTEPAPTTPATP